MSNKPLFLGIDFSTQQIKVTVIDDSLAVVCEEAVKFDTDLPAYRTTGGVHLHEDGRTVTAPVLMWIEALDVTLKRLKEKCDLSQIVAISGCGQQHSSVFWKIGSRNNLQHTQADKTLLEQLKECFSVFDSPSWMDSSTGKQCRRLEECVGGAQALADLTGSRAYERFTGSQIAKMYETKPDAYAQTERISIVSNFAASLFLGDYAPIDLSDGGGMNLLDISTGKWDARLLQCCAPNLDQLLGEPCASDKCIGAISSYLVDRYGFSPDCKIIAFTGDNPASLAGLCLQEGDVAVTLGTSDGVFVWLTKPSPALEGHVWLNPVDSTAYMALLCFKNGSLTRERIRDSRADGSWAKFNELLSSTPAGNNGNIGIYFDVPEITPLAVGVYRFNEKNIEVAKFKPEEEVRAVVEGQFLSRRLYTEKLGFVVTSDTRLLATGGASSNTALLQVLADVFGASVYVQGVANSASLGNAFRAKHGLLEGVSYAKVVEKAASYRLAVTPNMQAKQTYDEMLMRYEELENIVIARSNL